LAESPRHRPDQRLVQPATNARLAVTHWLEYRT
jgi:hypothetical protein